MSRWFFRNVIVGLGGFAAALGALAGPASAESSTGTIAVELDVTNACLVNGASSVAATLGTLGRIDFGAQPGLFGDVDAELVTSGGGALSVLCSPGAAPSLSIGAGSNDDNGVRHLAMGANKVAYKLFSDLGRTEEITIGGSLSLGTATSSAISVPIYARVNSNGSVLAAGQYTDTVQVTLSW